MNADTERHTCETTRLDDDADDACYDRLCRFNVNTLLE